MVSVVDKHPIIYLQGLCLDVNWLSIQLITGAFSKYCVPQNFIDTFSVP